MSRILSAALLIPLVVAVVWLLPPIATLVLACVAAVLAFTEYAALVRALGAEIPRMVGGAAVVTSCIALALTAGPAAPGVPLARAAPLDIVLLSTMIAVGAVAVATRQPGPGALRDTAATVLAVLYIGLPLGALVAVLFLAGREVLLLLLAVIVVSDSAQYYTGRLLGRRPLAPAISPKKTVEGAAGGLVAATLAMIAGGAWAFRSPRPLLFGLVGATIAALGIVGDLFESLLKRSAGVKDSSHLIPGHGGMLDRIDSWLFAAPVYYVFVRYLQ